MNKNVAILGASPKEDRYANMAQKLLTENGYNVYPINPAYEKIENRTCYKRLADIKEEIDTVTVYMNPERLEKLLADIIAKKPRRIIFNPGTESEDLKGTLNNSGIEVVEACTLVMLKTGQF